MMTIDANRLVDLFLHLVKINAVSRRERPVADFIKQRLQQLGISFFEDNAAASIGGTAGNIIARMGNDSDPNRLLLAAHMDTVQPTKDVQPVINNGIITSGGRTILGADNRAGVAVILYIAEFLTQQSNNHKGLELVFTAAEETGMQGIRALDFQNIKSAEGFVLDCSRDVGCYVEKTPTAVDFIVECTGKAAHSAVAPENGINAISMAGAFIEQMPVGRIDDDTVVNIGKIRGGRAVNVVPDKVEMKGEIRSFDADKISKLQRFMTIKSGQIQKKYKGNITVRTNTGFHGFFLSPKEPVVQQFHRGLKSIGLQATPLKYYGGSDANVLNQNGIKALNIGIGAGRPHSVEEHISIENLVNTARLILQLAGAHA